MQNVFSLGASLARCVAFFVLFFCYIIICSLTDNKYFFFHCFFYLVNRNVRIIYETLDSESTGQLNPAQVRESFQLVIDITLTDEEFNKHYGVLDRDADGTVSFKEFKKYFKNAKAIKKEILDNRAG